VTRDASRVERRAFLRGLVGSASLPLVASALPAELLAWGREAHAAAREEAPATAQGLDAATRRTLDAACDRILPADETPGALAAGVPAFVVHMLDDWYDAAERARVVAGLRSLEGLADQDVASQDARLEALDREGSGSWFATLKFLTVWGYCTSEVGVTQELGLPAMGVYDGDAPYAPGRKA
jgi:hypothetical protein